MKRVILFILILCSTVGFCQDQIFVVKDDGNLYSRTASDCSLTLVGYTNDIFLDIALTPDGRLWGIDAGNTYGAFLKQINTSNGTTSDVGVITGLHANSLLALDNNTLLFEAYTKLYSLDIATAVPHLIGSIGFQGYGDLVWYENELYLSANSSLVRIVLNQDHTAILSTQVVNDTSLPFPSLLGLITVTHTDYDDNILLGFSAYHAFEICTIDGSWRQLCITGGVNGATATELPARNQPPTTCPQLLASAQFIEKENEIKFSQNPAKYNSNITIEIPEITNDPVTIKLVSLEGIIAYSKTETNTTGKIYEINLEPLNLSKGVYLVEATFSDVKLNSKLIVN